MEHYACRKVRRKQTQLKSKIKSCDSKRFLFLDLGLDLVPGVSGKNTTPEDLARSSLPHVKYLLVREMPGATIARLSHQLKTRLRTRFSKPSARG